MSASILATVFYFEFKDSATARTALTTIQQHICGDVCQREPFRTILNATGNENPCFLQITLLPHSGDLSLIATQLGAIGVTQNYESVWPKPKSRLAA